MLNPQFVAMHTLTDQKPILLYIPLAFEAVDMKIRFLNQSTT